MQSARPGQHGSQRELPGVVHKHRTAGRTAVRGPIMPGHPPDIQGSASPTGLALFLILLGFFVALTASVDFDDAKVGAVRESMSKTFRPAQGTLLEPPPHLSAHGGAGQELHARLSDILAPALPAEAISRLPSGTELEAHLPVPLLFGREGLAVRDPFPILDDLVTLISTPPAGVEISLHVYAPSSRVYAGTTSDDMSQEVARLGMLARALTDRGMPKNKLAIGLDPLRPDTNQDFRFAFHLSPVQTEPAP